MFEDINNFLFWKQFGYLSLTSPLLCHKHKLLFSPELNEIKTFELFPNLLSDNKLLFQFISLYWEHWIATSNASIFTTFSIFNWRYLTFVAFYWSFQFYVVGNRNQSSMFSAFLSCLSLQYSSPRWSRFNSFELFLWFCKIFSYNLFV